MGAVKLELRSPQKVNGIAADPQPDWSFDNLMLELDAIDEKLNVTLDFPVPFAKKQPRELRASKDSSRGTRGFVMHVSDDDTDYTDSDGEKEASSLVPGWRFACDELYLSDDSEDDLPVGMQCHLMDRVGLAEGALYELSQEFQLNVLEEVRTKISVLEAKLVNENEKFASQITKVEKHKETQRERERKFDLQYQRTIAEALDNHLTSVQRDHEYISQIEERRIRDDASREEAKRKEKAFQEEKLRQERIKVEEARLKSERAERAITEAIETEKKAAEEAAIKRAAEINTAPKVVEASKENVDVKKQVMSSAKNVIIASENALELEKRRKQIYEELCANNNALKASANQDYHRHGQIILRKFRTISETVESVTTKSEELMKLINNPGCPRSISIQFFVEKIVFNCTNPSRKTDAIFPTTRVIILVTSKIPQAMEYLVAALNRVCIYTVPKHISYSEEENGNIDDYLEGLTCYMKLYGAIIQTEIRGFQNHHGFKEGWAWLARFLNVLPANIYTAIALHSFLEMAGFALYRRYRNQFEKLLRIIARDFLNALKEGGSDSRIPNMNEVKTAILNYIELNEYKKEPKGLQLRYHIDSSVAECAEFRNNYGNNG